MIIMVINYIVLENKNKIKERHTLITPPPPPKKNKYLVQNKTKTKKPIPKN